MSCSVTARVYTCTYMCTRAVKQTEWSSVSADGERTARMSCARLASRCLYLQHGDKLLGEEKAEDEEVGNTTASARPSAKRGGQDNRRWKRCENICPWSNRSRRHCKLANTQNRVRTPEFNDLHVEEIHDRRFLLFVWRRVETANTAAEQDLKHSVYTPNTLRAHPGYLWSSPVMRLYPLSLSPVWTCDTCNT